MKKNVFSRTIAVLASMTVIGAASMLSASAKGVIVGTVEVEPGTTKVNVPVHMYEIESMGAELIYSTDSSAIKSMKPSSTAAYNVDDDGVQAVYFSGAVYDQYPDGEPFSTLTVELDPNAEPGTYPIYVTINAIDEGGAGNVDLDTVEVEGIAGAIVVKAPATEPEATEATAAPTTAAPATTAAATTTTGKPNSSPKTGSTGVAVAVAGLVTAGATAVVLKKKH